MTATTWPARLQRLGSGPLVNMLAQDGECWVDGGHNPDAARLIAEFASKNWGSGPPVTLLFASLKSKDAAAALAPFRGIVDRVLTLPIPGHDSHDPKQLVSLATGMGFSATPHAHLHAALGGINGPARVLIFGSLYLAGVALSSNGSLPD
jgi:dihydrofolate synthase/folylpolyglutamate synthase